MPHLIALRGHWNCDIVEPSRLRLTRSFGMPRIHNPRETIWLASPCSTGSGSVLLNGELLGHVQQDSPWVFEVTGRLHPRNRICIELLNPVSQSPGEVHMEIREPTE